MPAHRIHRTASPYNASELVDLDFEQTADTVYLAHTNHDPTKLIRAGHYDWTFSTVTFGPSVGEPGGMAGLATTPNTDAANSGNAYFPQPATYVVTAFDETTGQESRASTSVTLTNDLALKRNYNTVTWSAVAGATGYRVYKAENSQLYGYIGTTEALTFRDDNIGPDLSQGPPIADNPFSGANNKPGTITFHEQRSFWARTINNPNAVFASRSADYENMDFTRPSRENDAFVVGLVANKVNVVNKLVSSKQGLLALTSNNIFVMQGSNEDYITASPPPRVRPEIARGASTLKPLTIDTVTFYETSKNGEIRGIGYEFEIDGLKSNDVTIFSRHLFEHLRIVSWVHVEKPLSAIVGVRDDGRCVVMTWDQAQQVWGWTVWYTGELDDDGEPTDLFKSVTAITEQGEDRVYFTVQRTIEGEDKLYVERMASELWEEQEDACYLDCARTFASSVDVTVYDRLDHLNGRQVYAWVDGNAITKDVDDEPLVVEDGAVTLPRGGSIVTIGLPFTALIETLPLAMQTGSGWTVARPQQAESVVLRVVRTRNIEAGPDEDSLFEIKTRNEEDYPDPIALITGDLEASMAGTSGNETVVVARSWTPTPMHIAAVLIEPSVGDM
jgi:hypothetical protein